jgi:hypothetical protein
MPSGFLEPQGLNDYLNREVSAGRMSIEAARSQWAANNRIIDDAYNQRLKDDAANHEIRKARAAQAEKERIRDESYRNRLTDADRVRIAREKESRLEKQRSDAEFLRQENLKNNQPKPWIPSSGGNLDQRPSGTGNGSPSNDTISGRNDRSFVPSGGNSGGGGSGRPSGTGSSPPAPTGKTQTQTPVLTPDRPPIQSPWGGSSEPGGKIVKSGGLGGINQPVNPRGNGSPATPTPNSPNYGASQPPRSATGSSFGGAAGVGIGQVIAQQDAERARSRRERQAIADSQTPEQREQRANDHIEKYKDSFGGPRDYTYPPGYENTFGSPEYKRLVEDANRYRERNGMPPIGGNGAAGIGRGGIGGGASGIGGAAGQIGGSANPNWFSPSDPNQPWNAPYNPYNAIDPATGLPWIEKDKMPAMPSYPRPMAPIFQHPDGTPMPLTPDGRPIGPDGVPLWPPGDPNVPPIPGWIPPTPPDQNPNPSVIFQATVNASLQPSFTLSYSAKGRLNDIGYHSRQGRVYPEAPYNGAIGHDLWFNDTKIHEGWSVLSGNLQISQKTFIDPDGDQPDPSPRPEPFAPSAGRPVAPAPSPGGNPSGSPSPNGAPLGGLAPGSQPDGSAAPALAPGGSPAPGRMPGFSPFAPMSPLAPPAPRPSPSPTPNPQRNPQRDPGPQPSPNPNPWPNPSGSPSPSPGSGSGSSSSNQFKGGADPSGSPQPNPNPAPGGGSGTGTGTGNPPEPPQCRYPPLSSVSVDIFDGFDDEGEPKKKTQSIACLPDATARVKLAFAQLYEIQSKKPVKSEAIAIPEAWAVRRGTQRPQLVIVYAEIFGSGKLGSSRWSLTVPHYRGTAKSKISAPSYKRGNWQGQLTLNDGSTIVVNAASSEECKRSINKLKILVPNDYRLTKEGKAIKPRVVENPNIDLKSCNVVPVMAKYYPTGQKDMDPAWSQSLRKG